MTSVVETLAYERDGVRLVVRHNGSPAAQVLARSLLPAAELGTGELVLEEEDARRRFLEALDVNGNHRAVIAQLLEQATVREGGVPVVDLLDELLDRAKSDPGVPFSPEMVHVLAKAKKEDRARFESIRARLRAETECRVTELDAAIAEEVGEDRHRQPTTAQRLVALADRCELFHANDLTAFADVVVNGHRETWPLRSKGFKRWLSREYYVSTHSVPNADAMLAALGVIEGKAHYEGPERPVFVRVAELDGTLYLDLCDDTWRVVEIRSDGWNLIDEPPVRFRRAAAMAPLPAPVSGGGITLLRPFLNLGRSEADRSDDADDCAPFVLVVSYMVAVLRCSRNYPGLAISGEQGSAKSTAARIVRSLTDPSTTPLRALPRDERDLYIAAHHSHVLTFDNVSGLPSWLSDALCRLSTGGGHAARTLYEDAEETILSETRPFIINGIEDAVTRLDLADRTIFIMLEPITDAQRRAEHELWAKFEEARPKILGALLDAVACGLRNLPITVLTSKPRMADFALWATACESALFQRGAFAAAYEANRRRAADDILDGDPIACAIRDLTAHRPAPWKGTATALLNELKSFAPEDVQRSREWPKAANRLSGKLRRAQSSLRKVGILIEQDRAGGRSNNKVFSISAVPEKKGSESSEPSEVDAKDQSELDLDQRGVRTIEGDSDDSHNDTVRSIVRTNSLSNMESDDADDSDGSFAVPSGPRARRVMHVEEL